MIIFLIVLNYTIIERFRWYTRNSNNNDGKKRMSIENGHDNMDTAKNLTNRPIIELNGRSYFFSLKSIVFLIIGIPISSYLIYWFFGREINFWLQELIAKQTIFLLKFILNIETRIKYQTDFIYPWVIYLPRSDSTFRITLECTGVHIYGIFTCIIIYTPPSKDLTTREDFLWRKMKTFIISLIILYIFNLFRITMLIYLDYIGMPWSIVHDLINDFSGIIAAVIIFIILYRWMPEFFLSIYYIYPAIRAKIEKAKK